MPSIPSPFTVSPRAVIARINRKLKPELQAVRVTRGRLAHERDFGPYYLIDYNRNWITDKDVGLEELARELGVLKSWEMVED